MIIFDENNDISFDYERDIWKQKKKKICTQNTKWDQTVIGESHSIIYTTVFIFRFIVRNFTGPDHSCFSFYSCFIDENENNNDKTTLCH